MKNFCPECGAKLEKDYQFCPNCGTKLEIEKGDLKQKEPRQSDIPSEGRNIVYCKNCGEANDINDTICSSCGIKLEGSGNKHKHIKKSTANKKNSIPKRTNLPVKKQKSQERGEKKLNIRMLITILGGILIVSAIIVISSGVLNKPTVNVVSANQNSNLPGVDLNSINKINELETQLKNNPKDDNLRLQLAHSQNDAGFYDKAVENYKKYLEKNPKDADARIDMGVCYYNLGNYPTAINEMEEALKLEPKHQIGNLNLGIVNLAAGNLKKSKEWLEKTVAINPNSEAGKRAEELLKSHENNGGN